LLFCWQLHDQCLVMVVAGAGGRKPDEFHRDTDAVMCGRAGHGSPALMSTLFRRASKPTLPMAAQLAGESESVPTFILISL
jgi:hypothetical protein